VNVLDRKFSAIYFEAEPDPGFRGKGRDLEVWSCPFPYFAEKMDDPDWTWMANNISNVSIIPLVADFGLKFGAVHCKLARIRLTPDFEEICQDRTITAKGN